MDRTINIRHFLDEQGNPVAPFSPEAAIYDESGKRLSDKLKGLNLNSIREAQDEALSAIDEKENEAIGNFSSQRVIPDMLSPEVMDLIEASGGGTINNMPDGEDLTSKDIAGGKSVMQLADRPYNPSAFSGKGYTIMRKNVYTLSRGRSANILSQEMLSTPNTVYDIRYDFDLGGSEITVPERCTLKFRGGSIKNGTINLNNCIIKGEANCIINTVLLGQGSNNYVNSNWFTFNNEASFDCQKYVQSIFNLAANRTSTIDFNNEKFYLRDNNSINNSNYNESYNGGLYVYSNTKVNLYSTEFHSLPNLEIGNGSILIIFYQDNITINGGNFFGNADTDAEYGTGHFGIRIIGGKHIYINNTTVKNFNGDGIFVSRLDSGPYPHKEECDDVLLQNITSHYNSRMGITIICGTNIVINNCDIEYTGYYFQEKANPGAAIDVEPNQIENLENIPVKVKIINCFCKNNKIGISTGVMAHNNKELIRHIEIYNNIIYGTCFFETRDLYVYNNNFYNGIIYFRSLNSVIDNNNFNVDRLILSKKIDFQEDEMCNIILSNSNILTTEYNYTENTNKNININITNCVLNNGYKSFNNQHANIDIKNCIFNCKSYLVLDNVNIYNSTIKSLGLSVNIATIYNSNIEFNIPDVAHTYINSIDKKMNLICYNTLIKANEPKNNLYSLIKNETYNVNAQFIDCIVIGKIINNDINRNALNAQTKKIRDIYYEDNDNVYKHKILIKENKISYYNEENKLMNYNGLDITIKDNGTFSQKPLSSSGIPIGFQYFCTDKQTEEGQSNGIMIYHKGENIWVDSLGRVVE